VSVALLCVRTHPAAQVTGWGSEWTFWSDPAEAEQALHELCQPSCGPKCEHSHVVVWSDDDRAHVLTDDPPPLPLAELDAAKAAREKADTSIDPADHAVANALEGAVRAEQHPPPPPTSTEGIPDSPITNIWIPRPETQN
jgi:hypothetical protein